MFISTALERLEVIINKPYKKHITTLTSSRRLETHNTQYLQASANEKKNNNLTALTSTYCTTQKNCPWQKITRISELTWASQRFIHFLTKRGDEPFTREKKAGSARRVPG